MAPRRGPQSLPPQVNFLQRSIADGDGARMQQLFPEGDFFLRALTALAAANTASGGPGAGACAPGQPGRPRQGGGLRLRDGARARDLRRPAGPWRWQSRWRQASGDQADKEDVRRRAGVVNEALHGSRSGYLESYPGQYWPCDTVVAASALADAAALLGRPNWLETVRSWRAEVDTLRRPGLRPAAAPGGRNGPVAGGSAGLVAVGDPGVLADDRQGPGRPAGHHELVRLPPGVRGPASWDSSAYGSIREAPPEPATSTSGPLVLGVSASASTVTLAAARAVGDVALAEDLSRQAELLGLPTTWGGERRYALGAVPVGDAFLAWARTTPAGEPLTDNHNGKPGRPWWPLFGAPFLLPLVALIAVGRRGRPA